MVDVTISGTRAKEAVDVKEWAKSFYKSKAWQDCRKGYIQSVQGLCERCLKGGKYIPGHIVHHKILLTAENISDPDVTLNWERLEYVCATCHQHEHFESDAIIDGYKFNEFGDMVKI